MLREVLDGIACRQPLTPALIENGTRVCYADLVSASGRLARCLAEESGVRRGDNIGACLPSGWEVAAGFFAAASMGAPWVPFHPQWRSREIAWLAGRTPLRVLITNKSLLQLWRDGAAAPLNLVLVDDAAIRNRLRTPSEPPGRSPSQDDDVAVFFTTSGSTGRPRVVPRTQANLLAAARSTAAALGVRPGMRVLSAVPFHHSGGFDNCMLLPLLTGATAVVLPAFNASSAEDAIAREGVQLLMGSPFIYSMLLESSASRASFASVETAISFGAPMPQQVLRGLEERLGLRIRQLYGATETGVIAIQPADASSQPGAVGQAVQSAQVHILDENWKTVEPGCIGDVAVGGAGVTAGYLGESGLNRELFRDGWFKTGDLGKLDAAGVLTLCGRSRMVLNVGGIKVDPTEIEHVLLEMPEAGDCVVRGVRDERQGEIIAATIGVRPGFTLTREAVVGHCRRRLAEFKIPRRIELVDAIARDLAGKKPSDWGSAAESDEGVE